MKHSKRMMAVVAAAGLAMGTLPGIANAQEGSEGLLDLNLGLNVGDSVELGVDLGLGSLGIPEEDLGDFPALAGSLEAATGATGSDDLDTGSEGLDDDVIGDLIEAGSAGEGGSGSEGSVSDSGDGDSGSGDGDSGSGDGDSGSGNGDDSGTLSSGSLTPGPGTGSGSGSDDGGTDEPDFLASLEDIFSGSASNGDFGSGSADDANGEGDGEGEDEGDGEGNNGGGNTFNSTEINGEALLAVGSLAAAGIAAGIAVSGGVDLPPLPGVDVGLVCELPQEGIDFLKGNGSMQPDECLPEEQN